MADQLEQLEKTLAEQQFIGGQAPTSADREAYESLKATPPTAATHPNTFAWFILTGMFTDPIKATWTGAQAAPAKAAKQVAAKVEAKKEEPKVEAKADDDDMDLFGDDDEDTEEAKKHLAESKAKAAAHNATKANKPAVIAKSIILFEVKPYEAETDLDALAAKILAIDLDGLVWKSEYKKEPIAYGVFKLIIGVVVEDLKVSVDDLTEKIEAFEDEVQSVDIKSFNKI